MTEGRVTIEEGVVIGQAGGRDLKVDVYTPPGEVRDAPGVLLLHGGGWRQGDRTQLKGYGILLGRRGYVCVAAEYRLVPEAPWPAQLDDVKTALQWMQDNAKQLGIDTNRIAVEGNSAGAHLALMLAGTCDGIAAAIAVYPPTLLCHGERERGGVPLLALCDDGGTPDIATFASPLTHVKPDFPPTMLIHGTKDELVPALASIRMYEALIDAGVPVELHMYADQPHAFDAAPDFGRQCAAEMLLFLNRYVREPAEATTSTN